MGKSVGDHSAPQDLFYSCKRAKRICFVDLPELRLPSIHLWLCHSFVISEKVTILDEFWTRVHSRMQPVIQSFRRIQRSTTAAFIARSSLVSRIPNFSTFEDVRRDAHKTALSDGCLDRVVHAVVRHYGLRRATQFGGSDRAEHHVHHAGCTDCGHTADAVSYSFFRTCG